MTTPLDFAPPTPSAPDGHWGVHKVLEDPQTAPIIELITGRLSLPLP